MDEQGSREPRDQQAWERYIEAERQDLRMRQEGHLAKMLGPALPDESPEELKRLADEDRRRAQAGLVELMDDSGTITYEHIDALVPEERAARVRAEGARIDWITDRQAKLPLRPRPGPTDPAEG